MQSLTIPMLKKGTALFAPRPSRRPEIPAITWPPFMTYYLNSTTAWAAKFFAGSQTFPSTCSSCRPPWSITPNSRASRSARRGELVPTGRSAPAEACRPVAARAVRGTVAFTAPCRTHVVSWEANVSQVVIGGAADRREGALRGRPSQGRRRR